MTGDILGTEESRLIGLVRVKEIKGKYSIAEIISGSFKIGQKLKPYEHPDKTR